MDDSPHGECHDSSTMVAWSKKVCSRYLSVQQLSKCLCLTELRRTCQTPNDSLVSCK